MRPKDVRSTVLTPEQEAMIVAFRTLTLLPLDAGEKVIQYCPIGYFHINIAKSL